ncbi:hypothetical protein BGX27_002687 [Mortierella sp. AM989]|nr:hypothetical protein BGX27_002687 [Mortierella sp. AM989]
MTLSHRSSTQSFGTVGPYSVPTPRINARPFSALPLHSDSSLSTLVVSKHLSLQGPPTLLHKDSLASIVTNSSTAYTITPNSNNNAFRVSQIDLRKGVADKSLLKLQLKYEQKSQQKKFMPLFPTERTRGVASAQNKVKPLDITKIDLLPIEFSRNIIMSCIDEIRLRGLKHKHLFRNPFYNPSVDSALTLLLNPKRCHLFNVKMMRMDTVGGLLTTVLSRTYPPLIPPELQEVFQYPNGHLCFELLGLLPELNRFLFVEILDLCCDLVDNQLHNLVSSSKLSVYPGSCCFGLDVYMPTWDTRYLLSSNVTKYSEAFYQILYGYRDERDLSAEELQQKQIKRDKLLADERREALEQEHGLEGAHNILKRESRIARGLPPDSPELPTLPSDLKEYSLYADRKETVVADDAISVLDIQLDDGAESTKFPELESISEENDIQEEDENVESVLADLRKSVSVATLESRSATPLSSYSTSSLPSSIASQPARRSTVPSPASRIPTQWAESVRAKTMARFSSVAQNTFPVCPSDIFGISRHAIERRELQGFLLVARTNKKRRTIASKRIQQLRLQNKRLRNSSTNSAVFSNTQAPSRTRPATIVPVCMVRRIRSVHPSQRHPQGATLLWKTNFSTAQNLRRERTRQLRKDIEVYQSRGLSTDEAMEQREVDLKKKKKREKRARAAALAQAEAAVQAAVQAELERTAAKHRENVTMEETEILEAFDYLTVQEFEEFMTLAGLNIQDVERIREKAAAAALSQVTEDIESVDKVNSVSKVETEQALESSMNYGNPIVAITSSSTISGATDPTVTSFGDAYGDAFNPELSGRQKQRPLSIPHMSSMDLLLKNAKMIGDSNLRCYPIQPPSTSTAEEPVQVPQQPQPTEEIAQNEPALERTSEDSSVSSAETIVSEIGLTMDHHESPESTKELGQTPEPTKSLEQSPESTEKLQPAPEPKFVTKSIPMIKQNIMRFEQAMQQKQQKQQEKVQPRSLSFAKIDLSKFAAPAPASAPAQAPSSVPAPVPTRAPTSKQIVEIAVVYSMQGDNDSTETLQILDVDSDKSNIVNNNKTLAQEKPKDFADNDEESAELRELLGSMSEEERLEFLRLSH